MSESANGQLVAADARRKLETFTRTVVQSKKLQSSGGMLGGILAGALPMVTTMLDQSKPETVAEFSALLGRAFAAIADPLVSEDQFKAQLASWITPDK